MATVGVIVHHQRDEVPAAARDLTAWLLSDGHVVRFPSADAERSGLGAHGSDEDFASSLDLLVSLGGDGTMLRALDLVAAADVPVLGVNFGSLGYLTEVEPAGLVGALERFFADDYTVEERMMLSVRLDAPSGSVPPDDLHGLNEAVLEKSAMGHTVRLDAIIDGSYFTSYTTDGLILATATGSTAYSFSARGPIMEPTLRAMLLTPVSPHMLFDRPLVLGPSSEIRLAVAGHRPATLSVDGRGIGTLQEGDAIVCAPAAFTARLVTFSPREFPLILKAKFGLSDR